MGGMGQKRKEPDLSEKEEPPQQDEETKVKELSTCVEYEEETLKNLLKKKERNLDGSVEFCFVLAHDCEGGRQQRKRQRDVQRDKR